MKNFKKALVSLAAAAVSAASFCAVPSASAEISGKYKTYKYVFKVKRDNSYIVECYASTKDPYDSNYTEFYKSGSGDLGGSVSVNNMRLSSSSRMTYVEYSSPSPLLESGTLGYIAFKTKSTPPSLTVTSIVDDRGNELKEDYVTVTPILIGDANGDTRVEIADATLILQHLTNPVEYPLVNNGPVAADVNFDGVVTKDDALLIQQLDAGMINGF